MWGWVALSLGALIERGAAAQREARRDGLRPGPVPPDRGRAAVRGRDRCVAGRRRGCGAATASCCSPSRSGSPLAPAALGSVAVFAPGFLLVAGSMASAAVATCCSRSRTSPRGGAGRHDRWSASPGSMRGSRRCPGIPGSQPLMVTLVLFLLAALGMQLMTFEDMTFELRRTNRRLEAAQSDLRQAVITDVLTGTRNRRFFDEVIGRGDAAPSPLPDADVDRVHRHRSLQDDQRHAGPRDRRPASCAKSRPSCCATSARPTTSSGGAATSSWC